MTGDVRQRLDVLVLRQIEAVGFYLDAMRLGQIRRELRELCGIGRGKNEIAAFAGHDLGDRLADAARRAGDQDSAALEIELHGCAF